MNKVELFTLKLVLSLLADDTLHLLAALVSTGGESLSLSALWIFLFRSWNMSWWRFRVCIIFYTGTLHITYEEKQHRLPSVLLSSSSHFMSRISTLHLLPNLNKTDKYAHIQRSEYLIYNCCLVLKALEELKRLKLPQSQALHSVIFVSGGRWDREIKHVTWYCVPCEQTDAEVLAVSIVFVYISHLWLAISERTESWETKVCSRSVWPCWDKFAVNRLWPDDLCVLRQGVVNEKPVLRAAQLLLLRLPYMALW